MNDDAAREKLAAALKARLDPTQSITWSLGDVVDVRGARATELAENLAAALLPVVRDIAAEELRAVMEDRTTVAKLSPVERLTCFIVKLEDLFIRADALHPGQATT